MIVEVSSKIMNEKVKHVQRDGRETGEGLSRSFKKDRHKSTKLDPPNLFTKKIICAASACVE